MAQANPSPATPRVDLPSPQTLYLPIVQHPMGAYVPESDLPDLHRDSVISAVASGTWDGILRILASDPSTGKCWDASAEIAKEALTQAADIYGGMAIPRSCLEFCEDVLGLNYTRHLTLQAA